MATFTVTTTADAGAGSLRQAVLEANATLGADEIRFDAGVFNGEAADIIRLTGGQIEITEALTIDGGTAGVTITGDAADDDVTLAGGITDVAASGAGLLDDNSRIFDASAALTLDGLTLTGGRTTAGSDGGGAVRGASTVTLIDSTVSGNSTVGNSSDGGGVFASADVTLTNSTVSGNSTAGNSSSGGGAYAFGGVTLTNSTVSDNSTAGAFSDGGGVFSSGGVFRRDLVTLTNSTVSGNSTAGDYSGGGGVYGFAGVTLTNSTVSGNSTAGAFSDGGGVLGRTVVFNAYDVTLTNSIVLGNATTGAGVGDDEVSGSVALTGGNILGGGDVAATDVFAATTTVAGVLAGVLADNGGPTRTILIRNGGAAMDAGGATALLLDQRGEARVSGPAADLGAVELQQEAGSLVVTTAADVVDALDGVTSLREAVAFANALAGADTVTFDAAVFDGGAADIIRLTGGQIVITGFTGGALTIDGGTAGVTITGDAAGDDVTLAGGITDVAASGAMRLDDNSRIFDASAALTLDGLTLTGGRTTAVSAFGGAVRGTTVTLIDSTVSGNSTAGDSARGGGVFGRDVALTNSTASGNSTAGYYAVGGGVYGSRSVTLTNSTVSDNSTTGDKSSGGGVFGGDVTLTNSTVSGNSTAGNEAFGGGIFGYGYSAVTLTNSIVLGNATTFAGVGGDEVTGALTLTGGNILGTNLFSGAADVGDVTATEVFAATTTIAPGVLAGVLADNGGPTRTIAILADGPAAGAADPATATASDQRGVARDAAPDLGAFEAAQPEPVGVIAFALLQIDTNGAASGGAINAPAPAGVNALDPAWVRPAASGLAFRQFAALVDADGDPDTGAAAFRGFDAAFNLSDAGLDGRVTSLARDNGADDPALVRGWGRKSLFDDGDLTGAVRFAEARGFGLDNRSDGATLASWLNQGDALDFALTEGEMTAARFTARVRDADGRPATQERATLALDVDGNTLVNPTGRGSGFATDAIVFLEGLRDGTAVAIDFLAEEVRVGGDVVAGIAPAFWDGFEAAGSDNLTLGTRAGETVGLALAGLEFDFV